MIAQMLNESKWYSNEKKWNSMSYPWSQAHYWFRSLFPVWSDWKIKVRKFSLWILSPCVLIFGPIIETTNFAQFGI